MADVGFDSDKHAQTNGDMEKGGRSLDDSCAAIGRLIDAQDPEHWSQEEGFLAMRTALITFLKTEDRVIRGETGRFQKFDGDVKTAVAAFTAAEQGTSTNSRSDGIGTGRFWICQRSSSPDIGWVVGEWCSTGLVCWW